MLEMLDARVVCAAAAAGRSSERVLVATGRYVQPYKDAVKPGVLCMDNSPLFENDDMNTNISTDGSKSSELIPLPPEYRGQLLELLQRYALRN